MARFLVALFAATVVAVQAGQLGHAAPSTAEVFWRAVLPGSSLPDAILRLLHPADTSFVSKRHGAAAVRAGDLPFNYEYEGSGKRPSAAAGAAREFDYVATMTTAARRGVVVPSPESAAFPVRVQGAEHKPRGRTPWRHRRRAAFPVRLQVTEHKPRGRTPWRHRRRAAFPVRLQVIEHKPRGEEAWCHRRKPGAFRIRLQGAEQKPRGKRSERCGVEGGHDDGVLPRGGGARRRETPVPLPAGDDLRARALAAPHRGVDSVHDACAAGRARHARHRAGLHRGSQHGGDATDVRVADHRRGGQVLRDVAGGPGGARHGGPGTRDIRPMTSTLPRAGAPLQLYTVHAVRPVEGGPSFVACHDETYPYTVYRCHTTGPARAYMVEVEGARGGGAVTVATVCHTDTSMWNPEHVSFRLLGTKPGGAPVCHLMPYGHIIWAKNVKRSPARVFQLCLAGILIDVVVSVSTYVLVHATCSTVVALH